MGTFINKRAAELGVPTVDSKKPLVLEVTAADIATANRHNSKQCGFARACKRVLKEDGLRHAYFFRTTAWLEYDDKIVHYALPPSMQKEIVAFDRNKGMEPGTYRLSVPSPPHSLEGRRNRKNQAHKKSKSRGSVESSDKVRVSQQNVQFKHRSANVRTLKDPGNVG